MAYPFLVSTTMTRSKRIMAALVSGHYLVFSCASALAMQTGEQSEDQGQYVYTYHGQQLSAQEADTVVRTAPYRSTAVTLLTSDVEPLSWGQWLQQTVMAAGTLTGQALTAARRGISQGISYATHHPLQALTLALSAQITTTNALSKRAPGDEFNIALSGDPSPTTLENISNGNTLIVYDSSIGRFIDEQGGLSTGVGFPINYPSAGYLGTEYRPPRSYMSIPINTAIILKDGNILSLYGRGIQSNGKVAVNKNIVYNNGTLKVNSILELDDAIFRYNMALLGNDKVLIVGAATSTPVKGIIIDYNDVLQNIFDISRYNSSISINLPNIITLDNNQFLNVWYANNNIRGRFADQNGTPINTDFQINQNSTNQISYAPALISLANSQTLVAWHSAKPEGISINGRLIAHNGSLIGPEFSLVSNITQARPFSLNTLYNGYIAVAWTNNVNASDRFSHIYGRLFSPNGQPASDIMAIALSIGMMLIK